MPSCVWRLPEAHSSTGLSTWFAGLTLHGRRDSHAKVLACSCSLGPVLRRLMRGAADDGLVAWFAEAVHGAVMQCGACAAGVIEERWPYLNHRAALRHVSSRATWGPLRLGCSGRLHCVYVLGRLYPRGAGMAIMMRLWFTGFVELLGGAAWRSQLRLSTLLRWLCRLSIDLAASVPASCPVPNGPHLALLAQLLLLERVVLAWTSAMERSAVALRVADDEEGPCYAAASALHALLLVLCRFEPLRVVVHRMLLHLHDVAV